MTSVIKSNSKYNSIIKLYRQIVCDCVIESDPSLMEYHDCPLSEVRNTVDIPLDVESQIATTFHATYHWLECLGKLKLCKLPRHIVDKQVTYKDLIDVLSDQVLTDVIMINEIFYEEYPYDIIDNVEVAYISLYTTVCETLKPYIKRLFHPKYWSVPDRKDNGVIRVYV